MIVLSSSQVVTLQTTSQPITWVATYADHVVATVTEDSSVGTVSVLTETTAVTSPASGTRVIKNLNITNGSASSAVVTVRLGTAGKIIATQTIPASQSWDVCALTNLPVGAEQAGAVAAFAAKFFKNVKQYGAIGDGVTDDTVAIQNAFNGAGDIYVPPGTYKINKCIRVYSNSNVQVSPNALFVNTRTDANTYEWATWGIGVMHPACFDYAYKGTLWYLPAYDIVDVAAGATSVTFITPAHSSNFAVDQMVVVRSIADKNDSGNMIPLYIQFAKVLQVGTGTITLDVGLTEGIIGATVSPFGVAIDIGFTGVPWNVVDNVHINGGRYDCESIVWGRSGMYRSSITNMVATTTNKLLATFNACGKSLIDSIYGQFSQRGFELKCGAHDTIVRNLFMSYKYDGVSVANSGFEIGEQSRDLTIEHCVVTIGSDCTTDVMTCILPGRRIILRDSIFSNLMTSASGAVMAIPSLDGLGNFPIAQVTLQNVELIGTATLASYLRLGYAGSTTPLDFVYLTNVRFTGGTPTVGHINYEATTINVFTRDMGTYYANRYTTSLPSGNIQTIAVGMFSAITGTPNLAIFGNRGNCWAMDSASTEEIAATVPAPLRARSVSAELVYTNLGAGSGNVRWDLTLSCIAVGGNGAVASSQENFVDTAPAQNYTKALQFYGSNRIQTDVDMISIRVRRMGADAADTLANDAGVLGVRLRWY